MRIGLISDTHGLLRPQALSALAGTEHLVHAGDIVDPAIVKVLAACAPLTAVRGNNDLGAWADALPELAEVTLGGVTVLVIHDLADLDRHTAAVQRAQVIVSGHSHRPLVAWREGRLYVNPGSAGPRRFKLPISVGELVIDAGRAQARIIELA